MRTIIAGSRGIVQPAIIELAVRDSKFEVSVVLSGTASGVDRLGERWAELNGIPIERYPADWDKHGKLAGFLRNQEMVTRADALIAVWDGVSRGTRDVINRARKAGLKVFIYYVSE